MRTPEKIRRKDGTVWQLRVPDAHGRMRYHYFATRKEADAAASQFDVARRSGAATVEDRRFDELVQEFRAAHLAHGLRASSVRDYEQSLARCVEHFGKRALRGITTRDIEQFRNELLKQIRTKRSAALRALVQRNRDRVAALDAQAIRTPRRARRVARLRGVAESLEVRADDLDARSASGGIRTVNKALSVLRMLFNFAESRRYTSHNPARFVRKLPRTQSADAPLDQSVLTPAELERLIQHTPPDWRAAVMVLGYGGLRLGELG